PAAEGFHVLVNGSAAQPVLFGGSAAEGYGEQRTVRAKCDPRSPGGGRTDVPGACLTVRAARARRRLGVHGRARRCGGSRTGGVPPSLARARPFPGGPSVRSLVLHDPAERRP